MKYLSMLEDCNETSKTIEDNIKTKSTEVVDSFFKEYYLSNDKKDKVIFFNNIANTYLTDICKFNSNTPSVASIVLFFIGGGLLTYKIRYPIKKNITQTYSSDSLHSSECVIEEDYGLAGDNSTPVIIKPDEVIPNNFFNIFKF